MLRYLIIIHVWVCVYGGNRNYHASEGVATAGNYTILEVRHFHPLRIVLHSLTGDADLYVGYNPEVSFELNEHNGSSTSCGLDYLDIPSYPRPVFIAIYGHPFHKTSIFHMVINFGKNSSHSMGEFSFTNEQIYDWDKFRIENFGDDEDDYDNDYDGEHDDEDSHHSLLDILFTIMEILFFSGLQKLSGHIVQMVVTDPLATTFHLQAFDKGLRSRSLGDQLSTVVNTSVLLDGNPFPLFVNQIVVKLADAFRDGSNELRLCVARVLSECHSHLSLVFSRAEILKKIMTVSHSNDPEARALTLQVLASLAPVFPDNKQVHHLIMESLSTENDLEFKSACHAMAEISKLSADFADTVIPLLSTLLQSSDASIERKSLLIPVFGGMKAMVSTTEKIFQLAHSILETYTHMPLICSLLETMTKLAEATRYAIPDQLTILLSALNRSEDNVALALAALNGLQTLAKHSHVWNEDHMKIILEIEPRMELRPLVFNNFLNFLIVLSQHARPNQLSFFEQMLAMLISICTSPDYHQRVSYLQIACNVFCSQPNTVFAQRLVNFFLISIDLPFKDKLLRKFYRALGDFFCCGHLSETNISDLLNPLILLDRNEHLHKMPELINLFCRLTDHLPMVVSTIHEWARGTVQILEDLSETSIAFLLLAPGVSVPESNSNVIQGNDWERYRVAKIAFRNGHWREAALINLKHIDITKLSYQSSRWICFLQELSAAQLNEVTVQAYEQQKTHLTNALSIVDVLLTEVQEGSEFRFPRSFTHCMVLSNRAIFDILSGFSTFQKLPEQYKMPGTSSRLRALIMHAINTLELVINSWNILIRSSYGADYQTHDYISILQCMYTIINYGLLCLVNRSSARTPVLPILRVETTSLRKSLNLLNWANEQMTLINGKSISEEYVNHFFNVLKKLCSQRVQIPRYFFHQGESTNGDDMFLRTGRGY